MRFDKFINKNFPKEKIEQGDAVVIFLGRGNISGLVVKTGKRQSRILCVDGVEQYFDNRKIRVIKDERWVHEIKGAIAKLEEIIKEPTCAGEKKPLDRFSSAEKELQ